jgi:protein-disulfide isomerase
MSLIHLWVAIALSFASAWTSFLGVAEKVLRVAALLLLTCTFLGWSVPAQAATRISPRLEEQVMQIMRDHPEVILESVQAYQQQQAAKLQQAQQAFLQELKVNPQAVIGQSPVTGAAETPKMVLVEFSDFQCPYCAEAHKTLKQLVAKHPGELKLVFKNYPLNQIHGEAVPAAKAAWAAGQQGKFWEYHDALFGQQNKLGEELYLETAKSLNLDLERFNQDRTGEAVNAALRQDVQLAQSLGIGGTPFFVANKDDFSGAVQLTDIEGILTRASKVS